MGAGWRWVTCCAMPSRQRDRSWSMPILHSRASARKRSSSGSIARTTRGDAKSRSDTSQTGRRGIGLLRRGSSLGLRPRPRRSASRKQRGSSMRRCVLGSSRTQRGCLLGRQSGLRWTSRHRRRSCPRKRGSLWAICVLSAIATQRGSRLLTGCSAPTVKCLWT